MRRTFALMLLLTFLFTGCARQSQPQAPAVENQAPAAAGPAPESAPTPAGELQRIQIKPGQPIDRVGLFIMKVATGEVEGWVLGTDQGVFPGTISDDNRWISVASGQADLLADRTTGTVYRGKGRLLAARGNVLLFSGGGGLSVTADGMQSFHPVAINTANAWPQAVAIAPDGKHVALLSGAVLYLIDPAGGQFREVGRVAAEGGQSNPSYGWLAPASSGVTVIAGFSETSARAYRYTWEGKPLGDQALSGNGWFSPDGKWVAAHGNVLGLAHTIAVSSAGDAQPRVRLKGELSCSLPFQGPYWLSDSSGLMVSTTRGPRLVKLDGTLTEPAMPAESGMRLGIPVPAPDRLGVYALDGTTAIDDKGKVLAAAVPASPGKFFGVAGNIAPWGDRSDELRFTLKTSGKGVSCDGPSFLAPSVETAPFPANSGLTVKVGAGDCVNLRQDFSKDAPVVACLPGGTRLTAARPPGRLGKAGLVWGENPLGGGLSDEWWWYAKTDQGQRGWVYLAGDYLAWASAGADGPAPDALQTRLEDDIVNLRYWLGVAAGQTYCGATCSGYGQSLPMMAFGGLHDWCLAELPALETTRGYDPAGTEAVALAKTCAGVQSLFPIVGRTDRDDLFTAKALELLPGLPK